MTRGKGTTTHRESDLEFTMSTRELLRQAADLNRRLMGVLRVLDVCALDRLGQLEAGVVPVALSVNEAEALARRPRLRTVGT